MGTGYTDWEGVSVEPLPIGASPAALVTGKQTPTPPCQECEKMLIEFT